MPSTLVTFADSEVRMRFKEPFLTEGLNAKLAVNQPRGIYQGFRLSTHASDLTVTVVAHPVGLDHSAVYQTGSGRSLTLRKEGGNFGLNLAAYASKTVVIAIYATYVLGSETEAEIRVYELLPTDEFTGAAERPELVVLGKVVVPAAGVIAAASITHDLRSMAWEAVALEATTWSPLLRNGGFEFSEAGATHARAARFWASFVSPSSGGSWSPSTTDANTGVRSLQFSYVSGTPTAAVSQPVNVPVTPGQLLRVQVYVKAVQILTAGSISLQVTWRGGAGSVLATSTVAIPATGVDASYRRIEATIEVPAAPAGITTLSEVLLVLSAASFGVAAAAIRFDDVQVFVESQSATGQFLFHLSGRRYDVLSDLLFEGSGDLYTADGVALNFSTAFGLKGERKDQNAAALSQPYLDWRGRIALGQSLLTTAAQATTARITTPAAASGVSTFTLLWEGTPSSGYFFRIYIQSNGTLTITQNAFWNSATALWNKDTLVFDAIRMSLAQDGLRLSRRLTDTAWADAGWDDFIGGAPFLSALLESGTRTIRFGNTAFKFTDGLLVHSGSIQPLVDNSSQIGNITEQYQKIWTRQLAVGPDPAVSAGLSLKGAWNYPAQTEQVEFESASFYWGIWQRTGHRFAADWDTGTATPDGWSTSSTGAGAGSNTLQASNHRTIVAHNGAGVGTFTLGTLASVKFRLTDGVVCRIRFKHAMGADFTMPRIGFRDITGASNGLTFGPTVVDGGGSHAYGFLVGAASTIVGANEHVFSGSMRWMTFAVVGSRLFWSYDQVTPDGIVSPSDSFSTSGGATITVPTGQFNFAIHAVGAGGGFGSAIEVDHVEIISGSREA